MQSKFSELFPIKGFLNLLFLQHCLVHCRAGGLLPRRIERPDIDGEDDVDDDGDDDCDDDCDDDGDDDWENGTGCNLSLIEDLILFKSVVFPLWSGS